MKLSKECTKCGVEKPYASFHKHKTCKGGVNTVCKDCRKPLSKKQYDKETQEYRLWYRAKSRAKKARIPFDIDIDDIEIPLVCPVLGTPMDVPSLDKHEPSLGYIKGNIVVMSNRANVLKNNGTIEEFEKLLAYLKSYKL